MLAENVTQKYDRTHKSSDEKYGHKYFIEMQIFEPACEGVEMYLFFSLVIFSRSHGDCSSCNRHNNGIEAARNVYQQNANCEIQHTISKMRYNLS